MTGDLIGRVMERVREPGAATTVSRFVSSVPRTPPRQSAPLPPPATLQAVAEAEALLGFSLPPLLSQLYTTVANGGFGPGYGIVGLRGGYLEHDDIALHDGTGLDLVGLYYGFRKYGDVPPLVHDFGRDPVLAVEPEGPGWYDKLLVLVNHGCWQLSCLDCTKAPAPVLSYVGYDLQLRLCYPNIEEWIEAWLEGRKEF